MHNFKQEKPQKGVTLIELMIALALGVIVIVGVMDGMLSLTYSNRTQITANALQERGNTALDYLTFQLRSALSSPCDRYKSMKAADTLGAGSETKEKRMLNGLGIEVAEENGSDSITFLTAGERNFLVNEAINFTSSQLEAVNSFSKNVEDKELTYVLTNCKAMDVIKATMEKSNNKVLKFTDGAGAIQHQYEANSATMVAPLSIAKLYIKDNKLYEEGGDVANGPLVDDIEQMRLFFAVDETGNNVVDKILTTAQVAAKVAAFNKKYDEYLASRTSGTPKPEPVISDSIISAEIYLVVRADEADAKTVPKSYTLNIPTGFDSSGKVTTEEKTFTDQIPRKIFRRSAVFRNNTKFYSK